MLMDGACLSSMFAPLGRKASEYNEGLRWEAAAGAR